MKTKFLRCLPLLVGGLLLTNAAAHAQTTPGAGGRLAVVEIKDASLKDAINLVFRAAGLPLPIIDESASNYFIPDVVRQNIDWNDLARQLCASKNFKISRNPDGQYVIEPRVVPQFQNPDGSFGFGEGFPGAAPANPFGGGGFGSGAFGGRRPFTQGAPLVKPRIETQANAQFNRRGRNGRGQFGQPDTPVNYTPIQIRHVYAGGIAQLFQNSGAISTLQFAVPESGAQAVGNGSGVGGGFGGGGGGLGGGLGGGIGGGGGFGGGIGGGGGFGGSIGGGGGGGFGGGFR